MQTKVTQLSETLEQIKDAPRQFGEKLDELKQTPGGQKLVETDARIGRYYATIKSLLWFVAGIPVLIAGYLLVLATDGTTGSVIVIATTALICGLIWMGVRCIRNARAASDILIEELEDTARPARWTLRLLRSVTGLGGSKSRE